MNLEEIDNINNSNLDNNHVNRNQNALSNQSTFKKFVNNMSYYVLVCLISLIFLIVTRNLIKSHNDSLVNDKLRILQEIKNENINDYIKHSSSLLTSTRILESEKSVNVSL